MCELVELRQLLIASIVSLNFISTHVRLLLRFLCNVLSKFYRKHSHLMVVDANRSLPKNEVGERGLVRGREIQLFTQIGVISEYKADADTYTPIESWNIGRA